MMLCSVSAFLLLVGLSACEGFLVPVGRRAETTAATTNFKIHHSSSQSAESPPLPAETRSGGVDRQLSPKNKQSSKSPRAVGGGSPGRRSTSKDFNRKRGMIQRPKIFDAFDPSSNRDDSNTISLRTSALKDVPNERLLTSILNSWAQARHATDAGDRCLEVVRHLRDNEIHLRPDVFLYSVVINAYAKRKQASKANEALEDMLNTPGIEPGVSSFICVMNAWCKSGAYDGPEKCRELLERMTNVASSTGNKNLAPDIATYTAVIDAYASRGRAREAEEVLTEMLDAPGVEPDVKSFSYVMKAWSKSDADDGPERCKQLLGKMTNIASSTGNKNVAPNVVSYTIVINAFASRGRAKEAEEVLTEMLDAPGVEPDAVSFNCVMKAWSKSDADDGPEHCKELLETMTQKASSTGNNKKLAPDTVTYNTMIEAYASRGRMKEADEVLREMMDSPGVEPDSISFSCLLKALFKSDADDGPERCRELLNTMTHRAASTGNRKLVPNTVMYNSVIDAYARRGRANEAEDVLREMLAAPGVEPDDISFNCVLKAWSRSDSDDGPERCKELVEEMTQMASSGNKKLAPNTITYNTVIEAYASRRRARKAEEVLKEMFDTPGIEPDVQSFASVMKAWSKSDADDGPERCKELLNTMTHRSPSTGNENLVPNTVTYNTVIDAYASRGRAREAEEMLTEMMDAPGVEPDVISFSCVMKAWSNSDAEDGPERCRELLERMTHMASSAGNKEVAPQTVIYTSLIDSFAVRGRAREAEEVLREMLNTGIEPDVLSFTYVMKAWSKSDAEDAPERCKELLEEMTQLASKGNKRLYPSRATRRTFLDAFAVRGRATEGEAILREMNANRN